MGKESTGQKLLEQLKYNKPKKNKTKTTQHIVSNKKKKAHN